MFVRTQELDRLLRLVRTKNSVEIVGSIGSGKTSLLAALIENLERGGQNVLHIRGHRSLSQFSLEPLILAGVDIPGSTRTALLMSEIIDSLTSDLLEGSLVLVVDDIEMLDDRTFAILKVAEQRSGAVVVSSRTLPSLRAGDTKTPLRLGSRITRVLLQPLTLDMASELIHALLSEPVDHTSGGRIYARTGGNAALIEAMVQTGVNSGFLRRDDTGWATPGGLWHSELEPSIEHLFDRLLPEDLEALEMLSLSTFMDLEVAVRLTCQDSIERLDADGLIDIVPEGEIMKVGVTPPLLSDYFMHRSSGARRARLVGRLLEELPSQEDGLTLHEVPEVSNIDVSNAEGRSSMLLARLLRDQRNIARAASRSAWLHAHTARTAIDYVDALFKFGTDSEAEIESVFRVASSTTLESKWAAQLEIRQAQWKALYLDDLAGALAHLASAALRFPSYAQTFNAHALRLEIGLGLGPKSVLERIEVLRSGGNTNDDWLNLAQIYGLLVSGEWSAAREHLEQLEVHHDSEFDGFLKLLNGLTSYAAGDIEETLSAALSELADARIAFDLPTIWMMTYVAALCQMTLGRYQECESTLNAAFAIGFAGAEERLSQTACYNLGSILATKTGRLSTATSLANQGHSSRSELWSIPAAASAWPQAHLDLFDGGPEIAGERLSLLSDELHERGLQWTAMLSSVSASEINPTVSTVNHARHLSREYGNHFTESLLDLSEALLGSDPEKIVAAANVVQETGALLQAATAYSAAAAQFRDAGQTERAEQVEEQFAAVSDRLGAPPSALQSRSPEKWQLTSREIQIAALAANGMKNQAIGERLSISVRTVENHLNRVYRKTGARSRSQLHELGLG